MLVLNSAPYYILILILIYVMLKGTQQVLQRKYVALVMGTPRHPKGLLSAPLAKVCRICVCPLLFLFSKNILYSFETCKLDIPVTCHFIHLMLRTLCSFSCRLFIQYLDHYCDLYPFVYLYEVWFSFA